tara:strand:+ start:758 stop:1798 length:1041 start_codon:yes stop_codon:yes gene_type:complete
MAYSPITKASDFFTPKLYTGNDTADTAITGVGFQPDFTWIKSRLDTENHHLFDSVRGATKYIISNLTNAQATDAQSLSSFNSDGFTVGTFDGVNKVNGNFASWNWKANGQGSSNTDGSINTTYTSVNTTAGFSMSTYTGNGTSGATIGHGLGVAPAVVLVKRLNATSDWVMYHKAMGASQFIVLNTNAAPASSAGIFYNTAPTSDIFYVGSDGATNASGGTYVAYCFAEIQGYSAFGKYRGNANASDGTFVNCGFRPSMVIQKRLDGSENWFIFDEKRDGFNEDNEYLFPNLTQAESSGINRVNLLSNGFKLTTTDGGNNANGGPYLYMAFGQTLVGSNNVPATAR